MFFSVAIIMHSPVHLHCNLFGYSYSDFPASCVHFEKRESCLFFLYSEVCMLLKFFSLVDGV